MLTVDVPLKKCPFCGSEAMMEESMRYPNNPEEAWRTYSVLCSNEWCIAHQSEKFYKTQESARRAWNRRADT